VSDARWLLVTLGLLAALACFPGAAAGADFTWSLTSDVSTSPLANPDKDSYGGHPWSYEEAGDAKLTQPDGTINGNLAGWKDPSGTQFVAITSARDRVVLQPSATAPAIVAWRSPVSGTVTVSGSVVADQSGVPIVCPNASWSVRNNNVATGAAAS
jgi:hypothetical protein